MTYTDLIFWPAFAAVLLVMMFLRNSPRARNIYLLAVSLALYWYCGGLTTAVLLLVILSDYSIARGIHASRPKFLKRLLLGLSLIVDISLLCYFKYAGFITDIINGILHTELLVAETFPFSAMVPIGISFFIFKNIGYEMDVYRGKITPVYNFWDFAAFVTFFPVIMSGPILRADQFVPQLHRKYNLSRKAFGLAVFWIINGLAKKIILGDFLAANFIDRVFDNARFFTGFETLCAAFGFSLELYADFSGYTDIATGVALLMGFWIPRNFDSPYKSTDAQGFWKRWHISLSSWLQEYLYYPLGGNRKVSVGTFAVLYGMTAVAWFITRKDWTIFAAAAATVAVLLYYILFSSRRKRIKAALNTMVTMLLGGLWHGASFNYILWGGINGAGIIASRVWKDAGWKLRPVIAVITFASACFFKFTGSGSPAANVFFWVAAAFLAATVIRSCAHMTGITAGNGFAKLGNAWAVLQTFVFVTFAWIFFRSSSYDNAMALISQIGDPTQWNLAVVGEIVKSYWKVFTVIIVGLGVHWIPERCKRSLRIRFASMPLPLMAFTVIIAVIIIIQFASATPHPFIYFQF